MTENTPTSRDFLKTIATTVSDHDLLSKGDRVLAAVSGGPDSVAMVLALSALKERFRLDIGIAHVNHLLRGEDAGLDEIFTRDLADSRGLDFYSIAADVAAYAEKKRLSIEESGRDLRYAFFKKTADRLGYSKIATGHTRDDNAEAVLINLLRGSGPRGLAGIPPVRESRFIRPMIRTSKQEILDFLDRENQPFRTDASNTDRAYLRNRIRHDLIPLLESEYNPEIRDALDRLSRIVRQEDTFLEDETKKAFKACRTHQDAASVSLSKKTLLNLHPALLNRVLRRGIRKVKLDLKRISLSHLDDITAFCFADSPGTRLDLPGQIRVYKKGDVIIIRKEKLPLREIGRKEKRAKRQAQVKQGDRP